MSISAGARKYVFEHIFWIVNYSLIIMPITIPAGKFHDQMMYNSKDIFRNVPRVITIIIMTSQLLKLMEWL